MECVSINFKVKCVCFNMKPIFALLGLCNSTCPVIINIHVCKHSMAGFRGSKSSVSFQMYFELHNVEFLKTCTFYIIIFQKL